MFVSTVISSTPFGRAVDVCRMYCVYHRECERNIHSKVPYKYIPNYCLNSLLLYPLFNLKCFSLWIPYLLDWTLRLLFISLRNFVQLLLESGYYLRAVFKLGVEDEESTGCRCQEGNPKRHCRARLPLQPIPNSSNQTPSQMSWRRTNSFWKTAEPLYYAFYNP